MVVTLHVLHPFDITLSPHASLAVDFFFCLSGFVLAYAYENRLLDTMSFADFAVARIIRLYPMILAGLLLGASVYIVRAAAMHHQSPVTPDFLLAMIGEALLVPLPPILGESWPDITPFDTPAWSLFFEVFANFAYALFVVRLTKPPVMTFALILGAIIVSRPSLCLGWRRWRGNLAPLERRLWPRVLSVPLRRVPIRRWNAQPSGAPPRLAPFVPVALLAVLLCPSPLSVRWLYDSCAVLVVFPLIICAGAIDAPGLRATSIYLFLAGCPIRSTSCTIL